MKHLIKKHRFLIVSFSLLIFLMSVLSLMLTQFPADAIDMGAGVISPLGCSVVINPTTGAKEGRCIAGGAGGTCKINADCAIPNSNNNYTTNSIGVCVGEICTPQPLQGGVSGDLCNLNNGSQDCKKDPLSPPLGCSVVINPTTGAKEGKCIVGGAGGTCKINADCQAQTKGCGLNSSGVIACVLGGNGGPCSVDNDCSQYQQFGCDYLNGFGRCILNGKDGSCVSASDCKEVKGCDPLTKKCVIGGTGGSCNFNNECETKPTITSVVPAEVPLEKPTTVTIIGNNFTEESKVVINGKVLPINMQESTPKALSVDVPRAIVPAEGNYNVKVLNPGSKDNLGFSNPKPISVVKKINPTLPQNPVLKVGAVGVATQLLNIRSDHSAKATVLSKLAVDETATITAGPVTSDGYVWWQVSSPSVASGWVAEKVVVASSNLGGVIAEEEAFFIANKPVPKPKTGPTITKDQLVSCEGKDVGGVCRASSNSCTNGIIKGPGNPGSPYSDNKPARPFDDCKAKGLLVCCKESTTLTCEGEPNNGTCKKSSNDCVDGVISGLNGPFDDCKTKGTPVCCKPKPSAKKCSDYKDKQCLATKDCQGSTAIYPKTSDCNSTSIECCTPKKGFVSTPPPSVTETSMIKKCSEYKDSGDRVTKCLSEDSCSKLKNYSILKDYEGCNYYFTGQACCAYNE